MVLEFGSAGEGFGAVSAAVGPLLRVTAAVSGELRAAAEAPGTCSAAEGPLSGVDALVQCPLAGG